MMTPRRTPQLASKRYVIASTDGLYLTGWDDSDTTGPSSVPIWGSRKDALEFTEREADLTERRIRTINGQQCTRERVTGQQR